MVNDLSFSRFLQLRGLLIEARQDEVREKFILSAFIGWQMGAGAGKKFGEYLGDMGLSEKQVTDEVAPGIKGMTAKQAIAKAEEILAMARKKDKAG